MTLAFGQDPPKPRLYYDLVKNKGVEFISSSFDKQLDMKALFSPDVDMTNGIIGTVPPGDMIFVSVVEKKYNTLIYQATITNTSTSYSGHEDTFERGELGDGATYFPQEWKSRDIRTSAFSMDRKYIDAITQKPTPMLQQPIDVSVIIRITENSVLESIRIPGIGVIGANALFHLGHFCFDLSRDGVFPCTAWKKVKEPDMEKSTDFVIAAHRGIWGDNLGTGNPENSTISIQSTPLVTPVLESDVMITNDDVLVVSHDYNLHRLSDYAGSDRDYLFNMNFSQIENLNLRRRNEGISSYKYLKYADLIDLIVKNKLVLTIDIKDIRARYGKDKKCIDNCDFDNRTGDPETDSIASKKILDSWKKIFKLCYQVAEEKDALSHIAFKIPHDYDLLKTVLTEEQLSKVLFMPVMQASRSATAMDKALAFVDSWHQKAGKRVLAFETNFKRLSDPYLKPFSRNGKQYENLLHYVYQETGLRPGCYPEEPMGPRGIVSRWADWLIKDLRIDMRGDHFEMVKIPYGKIMVLTTDRPDVWNQISDIYSRDLFQDRPLIEDPNNIETINKSKMAFDNRLTEDITISVNYKPGILTIDGLSNNSLGNNLLVSDMQGRSIFKGKVTTTPQMEISISLVPGIYVIRISGNTQTGLKLIVNK